jgi:cell division protein FtsN
LEKRSQADKLSVSLLAMGLQTEMRTESIDQQEGYWVLIPPQHNREAAVAIVKQLREAGISDLWRFTSGSLAHAISLGLFNQESRAEVRRKDIAAKGFEAEVRPRYRQKNTYWLDFSYTGAAPLSEVDWSSIAEIYPGLVQRRVDCVAGPER